MKKCIAAVLVIVAILGLYLCWHGREATAATVRSRSEKTIEGRPRSILSAYSAPVDFYGVVVDETNQPVVGALAQMSVIDKIDAGSDYARTSNVEGHFELRNVHGARLFVRVAKKGYCRTSMSQGSFAYGDVPTSRDYPLPSAQRPAIFVLKRMGVAKNLSHLASRNIRVPKDGTPVDIDLITGEVVSSKPGALRVQVWTNNQGLDLNHVRRYPWRAILSIVGGGILERSDEQIGDAPEDLYSASFDVVMPETSASWQQSFQREFFARLPSGQYGRLRLELTTAGDHFVDVESFVNLTPGDRSLDFDGSSSGSGDPLN